MPAIPAQAPASPNASTSTRGAPIGAQQSAAPPSANDNARGPKSLTPRAEAIRLGPNMISVKHWERLENGALLATSPLIDWARLLRRGLNIDALECPKCHGRLHVMAVITERETAKKICERLGLPGAAPPRARARGPGDEDGRLSLGW